MRNATKRLLGVAAVVALTGLSMASVAGAADRLTVKDSSGTNIVFKVDDGGKISDTLYIDPVAHRSGFGLSAGHAPESSMHIVDLTSTAARGMIVAQHSSDNVAANIIFRKSHGDDTTNPTTGQSAVSVGDYIASFHGNAYTGTGYVTTATVGYQVDGPVTTAGAPMNIAFSAGTTAGQKKERLRISSSGNVVVGNLGATATTDMAVTASGGFLYIPTVAGTLTSCGTSVLKPDGVTSTTVGQQYAGHVPVWFDTTNGKICMCSGTTTKCTTALQ